MAPSVQITCINKSDRPSRYEAIESVGGKNTDGKRWKASQEKAIEWIETGKFSFYVQVGTEKSKVIVSKSQYGNKYLKTESDTTLKDNLLSLVECPL